MVTLFHSQDYPTPLSRAHIRKIFTSPIWYIFSLSLSLSLSLLPTQTLSFIQKELYVCITHTFSLHLQTYISISFSILYLSAYTCLHSLAFIFTKTINLPNGSNCSLLLSGTSRIMYIPTYVPSWERSDNIRFRHKVTQKVILLK